MANTVGGFTGGEVIILLDQVTQSAKSLAHCRNLHQVLSNIKPQTIVESSASPGAVEEWVQDLDSLLKEAQNLLVQALAWEEQSTSLPQAVLLLTRPKWARLINRVTARIKQVHAHANLESKIRKDRDGILETFDAAGEGFKKEEAAEWQDELGGKEDTLDIQHLQASVGRLEMGGKQKPRRVENVLESWKGWYEEEGLRYSMTAALFLTSRNKLCGFGDDALGRWTWEGEYVGIDQVVLRKQYVSTPDYNIQYSGTRFVKEESDMLEGFWCVLPEPTNSGTFFLEREESHINTAHGQLWSGFWKSGSDERQTVDTEFVLTSDNKLFGTGSDEGERVAYTGTYFQEGSLLKITCLKIYQPDSGSEDVIFWGEISQGSSHKPVVMEGRWVGGKGEKQGSFRLESTHLVTGSSTTYPKSLPTCGVGELESWEGWYQHFRQQNQVSAHAFLMDNIRPCGFGLDSLGEWTWEGDFVDDDRMLLRKQYVNNPSYRLLYDGIRTAESGEEAIRGLWSFADIGEMFEPAHTQKFSLIKSSAAAAGEGYGQHWTGHRETVTNKQIGSWRSLDGGALVLTNTHRIFGYGSDVQGAYTYLGKYTREGQGNSLSVRMVKLYVPGRACSPVQYRGQIDLRCLPAATTVMQGSWASADGHSSGTFRFQTQELDLAQLLGS